jgi:TPR repeat protein
MKSKIVILIIGLILTKGAFFNYLYAAGRGEAKTSCHSFTLSESGLDTLPIEAAKGDFNAAARLMNFYFYCHKDYETTAMWKLIAAENGDIISMKAIAHFPSTIENASIRDFFWLWRAVELGYDLGQTEDSETKKFNSIDPELFVLNDEYLPIVTYENITLEELKSCEDYALRGSGKGALLAATYYSVVVEDSVSAEYWYRIGAQNDDVECQYRYGQILEKKSDLFDRERGKFWKDKAVQGGYMSENQGL